MNTYCSTGSHGRRGQSSAPATRSIGSSLAVKWRRNGGLVAEFSIPECDQRFLPPLQNHFDQRNLYGSACTPASEWQAGRGSILAASPEHECCRFRPNEIPPSRYSSAASANPRGTVSSGMCGKQRLERPGRPRVHPGGLHNGNSLALRCDCRDMRWKRCDSGGNPPCKASLYTDSNGFKVATRASPPYVG